MKHLILLALVLGMSTSAHAYDDFQVQETDTYFDRAPGNLTGSDFTSAVEGDKQTVVFNAEKAVFEQARQKCSGTPVLLGDFQVEIMPSSIHCGGIAGQIAVTANFACD